MMETESQKILSAPPQIATLTDGAGRRLEVRQLTLREQMRLMRQWGAASNVEMWLNTALAAAMVYSIDGQPIPLPSTPDKAEDLIERVGPEGFKAIEGWVESLSTEAVDPRAQRAMAKN